MGTIAAAVRELIALGVQGDALVAAVERIEAAQTVLPAFEKRRTYDRERKVRAGDDYYASDAWIALREAAIRRDERLCAYCQDHEGVTLTADHVIPISRGGSNAPRNLVCCCVPCNNSKRNLLIGEWPGRSTTRHHRTFDHLIGHAVEDA